MDNFEIFLIPFLTFHVFLWPHAIAFFCFKSRTRANKRNVNTIQRKIQKLQKIVWKISEMNCSEQTHGKEIESHCRNSSNYKFIPE